MFPIPPATQTTTSDEEAQFKRTKPQAKPKPLQLSPDWTVSAWSKAGISTTILLRSKTGAPTTLLFDCGGLGGIAPSLMAQASIVFISHAHADHCGGLFAHARSRFAQSSKAKYFVPRESLPTLLEAKACYDKLDGHELNMEFIGVFPGFSATLPGGLFVECVAAEHRVPSVGFLLSRSVMRIKPEHQALSSQEKAALGLKKMLNETVRELQVSYSGDSTARGLDPRLFQARLAIVECTFVLDAQRKQAVETKHVLLSELEAVLGDLRNAARVRKDCQLLLIHFSARYNARAIIDAVQHAQLLDAPTALALAGFSYDPLAKEEDAGITFAK